MTDNVTDLRSRLVAKMTEDWPIEKKIGARAAVLFVEEHPEIGKLLGDGFLHLASAMVTAFEAAAIEYRDEVEWCVITDFAGLSPEEAVKVMNDRLRDGVSPITARLRELSEQVDTGPHADAQGGEE